MLRGKNRSISGQAKHFLVLYNPFVSEVYYQHRNTSQIWNEFQADRLSPLSTEELERFTGKRILITGAGGFIGSALATTLSTLPLTSLVLLDQAERGLHRISEDFRRRNINEKTTFVVGNVLNRSLLQNIFSEYKPDIVFHAAAHKHVPLMQQNPFAAAETNVLGTLGLVEEAARYRTKRFVLLSTDKAVDPVSVMGASKRIAEQIVLEAPRESPCTFVVARLCNVLGSTGSVGPLFLEEISADLPLPLTDSNATRFFLTIADAVRFLQRAGTSLEYAGVMIPATGPPRKIRELAEFLLAHSQCERPLENIVEVGLRPGEKLQERLFSDSEVVRHMGETMLVESTFDRSRLRTALEEISATVKTRNLANLEKAFSHVLPDFQMGRLTTSVLQETTA